jgi:uncharacterized protein
MKKIIRNLNPEETSFRAFEENGERYLEGYGSVFNKRSKQLFENNRLFYEVISPRSFDEILQSEDLNVILNFNHSRDRVLARTKSGTLELSVDEVGLRFKAKVPNTSLGNDIYELVSRGDLFECSFAFIVKKDDEQWAKDEEGNNIRTINRIAKLYDVSIVTDAAYSGTPVYARNDEELEEKIEPEPGDSEEEFIGKCIKYVMDAGEADDVDQASAICYSKWEEKQKSLKEEEEQQIQKEEEQKALQEAINEELQRMKIHIETLKLKFN